MAFKTLKASHDTCWRSDALIDEAGHHLSGARIHFIVGVKNKSTLPSATIWVRIIPTNGFTDTLALIDSEWGSKVQPYGDDSVLYVPLDAIKAGDSATFKFYVFFSTAFDIYYTFELLLGSEPGGNLPNLTSISGQRYSDWASNRVCF